jgi:hypothetical protein
MDEITRVSLCRLTPRHRYKAGEGTTATDITHPRDRRDGKEQRPYTEAFEASMSNY